MTKLCGKMVKRGVMTESRPCIRKKYHRGHCTPNLIGMRFGCGVVVSKGPTLTYPESSHTPWKVKNRWVF